MDKHVWSVDNDVGSVVNFWGWVVDEGWAVDDNIVFL